MRPRSCRRRRRLGRVYAHICDARGATHPYDDAITFSVSGEGCVIGDASIVAKPDAGRGGHRQRTGPGHHPGRQHHGASFEIRPEPGRGEDDLSPAPRSSVALVTTSPGYEVQKLVRPERFELPTLWFEARFMHSVATAYIRDASRLQFRLPTHFRGQS
jgi:hypothetical protein